MATILIIEDTQDNYDLLADALDEDHTLVHARDGASGLALAREIDPDIILLDMGLPGMDGWDVVRRLKNDAATASIPALAVTAHAMAGDEERCRSAGCDGYVTKPVCIKDLLHVVQHWLAGSDTASGLRPRCTGTGDEAARLQFSGRVIEAGVLTSERLRDASRRGSM